MAGWHRGARGRRIGMVGEDDPADTLVPRLLANGAELSRIHIIQGIIDERGKRSFDPATDMALLREAIEGKPIAMLIIDPIVSAVGGDSHKNAEVRRALQPIVDLAAECDIAVYGVTHFTKGTAGRDPVERITGSLAFGALTRIVTVAMKMPDEGNHPTGARLFARAKSNISQDGGGFYYFLSVGAIPGYPEIENTRIKWGAEVNGTARELIARAETVLEEPGATSDAVEWLRQILMDGPMSASDVTAQGKKNGFSESTLWRARRRLKISSTKAAFGKGWVLKLPEDITNISQQSELNSSAVNRG